VDHPRIHHGSVGTDNLLSLTGFGHRHLVRVVLSVCLFVSTSRLSLCPYHEVDYSRIHRGSVGPDNLLSLAGFGHCHLVRMFCLSIYIYLSVCLYISSVFLCLSIPILRWIILGSIVVPSALTTYFLWQVLGTAIW
jgi:hypothetical protein